MAIGYACLVLGEPGCELHTCTLGRATEAVLGERIEANLDALDRMMDYNIRAGIRLFRISSDIIPLATHPDAPVPPWRQRYAHRLAAIGGKAKGAGIRLSMHPGQYTVLSSPDPGVVARSVADLQYHADFLDALGCGTDCKLILHIGGAYGDKPAAARRFAASYRALDPSIRRRLVIENDDRIYNACEVLAIGEQWGIPVVFDNLHHEVNPSESNRTETEWIAACAQTWRAEDGPQKIHYSQQVPGKKAGSHSDTIAVEPFVRFYEALPPGVDVMLEVKDKNLSATKCIHCVEPGAIKVLEDAWSRYKYAVLERSPDHYNRIRALLKDKSAYPAAAFYGCIEQALSLDIEAGRAINAASHVWGYFKGEATDRERRTYDRLLAGYEAGSGSLRALKRHLYRLAVVHDEPYLLRSYYFHDDK